MWFIYKDNDYNWPKKITVPSKFSSHYSPAFRWSSSHVIVEFFVCHSPVVTHVWHVRDIWSLSNTCPLKASMTEPTPTHGTLWRVPMLCIRIRWTAMAQTGPHSSPHAPNRLCIVIPQQSARAHHLSCHQCQPLKWKQKWAFTSNLHVEKCYCGWIFLPSSRWWHVWRKWPPGLLLAFHSK